MRQGEGIKLANGFLRINLVADNGCEGAETTAGAELNSAPAVVSAPSQPLSATGISYTFPCFCSYGYLLKPAIKPPSNWRLPKMYSRIMGVAERKTAAIIAGTLVVNSPWKLHKASGKTRTLGLCVSTRGKRKLFQTWIVS